jgi:uncharacterized protein with PQ loop repeat
VTLSEVVGLSGALLAGYAYLPQISHLIREHCSAGLSERAFVLWLGASLLMTVHAITIGAVVFIVLGIQQIACTGTIAFYCRRYRDQACPSHQAEARGDAPPPVVARSRGLPGPPVPGRPTSTMTTHESPTARAVARSSPGPSSSSRASARAIQDASCEH